MNLSRFLQSSLDRANADISSEVLRSRGPIVPVAIHGPLGVYEGDGLIDTGADHTTIDERVFQQIGLKPIGVTYGQGVTSGKMQLGLYKAKLTFPGTKFPATTFDKIRVCGGRCHRRVRVRDVAPRQGESPERAYKAVSDSGRCF
jgi:hypothetical protein